MSVNIKTTDTRTIDAPVPASLADTHELAVFLTDAAAGGYILSAAEPMSSGDQRDPYTIGLRLTFKREDS